MTFDQKKNIYIYQTSTSSETYDITTNKQNTNLINLFVCLSNLLLFNCSGWVIGVN